MFSGNIFIALIPYVKYCSGSGEAATRRKGRNKAAQ
jgi:hypothetical protein